MKNLETDTKRFYEVLRGTPGIRDEIFDNVTLVFDDGKQVKLACAGRGPVDYDAMARPKYTAEPTAEQIHSIILKEGKEPVAVRYQRGEPFIEFTYNFVKSFIQKKSTP